MSTSPRYREWGIGLVLAASAGTSVLMAAFAVIFVLSAALLLGARGFLLDRIRREGRTEQP